jgi:hypothetical protein
MFGVSRRLFSLVSALALPITLFAAGCTCGSGPYEGDYDGDRPGSLDGVKFVESEKGDPKVIGCSDGQREGFADLKKHPRIAACIGKWTGEKGLRDKATGAACGDDGEACKVPADVCSAGWHVCGVDGKVDDLTGHTTVKDCDNAGPGRFNAAISHLPSEDVNPCPSVDAKKPLPCTKAGLGAEAVCCGNDCQMGKCKDSVWKGKTKISRGPSEGCGKVTSDRNPGILCCSDGEGIPGADAKAEDTKAPDAKVEDAKADEAKADDAKADDAKTGDAKTGDAKADDAKADEKKADDAKADEKSLQKTPEK